MLKNLNWSNKYDLLIEKRSDNQDALNFIDLIAKTNDCIFLTWKAGTGKSTLIKDIIELAKSVNEYPLVLWSTGISALNVWWQTVHSFFSLWIEDITYKNIQYYIKDRTNKKYKLKKEKVHILEKIPFIIIDEISMLSSNILDCIDFQMRYYLTKKTWDESLIKKPFAWKQLIFVWDVFQLPPVKTIERENKIWDLYKSERFFDSKVFKKLNYLWVELKKSYRQAQDQYFVEVLDAIRHETFDEKHIEILNRQQIKQLDKQIILLSTHRNKVSNINNIRLSELKWQEEIFDANTEWIFPNSMKRAEEVLKLKVGAKVVLLTNDTGKNWVNGSIGTITNILKNNKYEEDNDDDYYFEDSLEIDIDWKRCYVKKHIRDNTTTIVWWNLEKEVLWTYTQFPVQLAYAMTIHKSQWLTFDHCQVELSDTFAWWQAYTALSRSKTLDWLKIYWNFRKEHIFFDQRIKDFIKEEFQEKICNDLTDIEFIDLVGKEVPPIIDFETNETEILTETQNKEFEKNDEKLFQELVKVRFELSKEEKLPAYCIFHDTVLRDIAKYKPQNKSDMLKIKWIKEKKFEKYGQIIIDKIKELWYESVERTVNNDEKSYMEVQKMLHPNAYKKWENYDDEKLKKLFRKWVPIKALSKIFKRNVWWIMSRLKKLWLIK